MSRLNEKLMEMDEDQVARLYKRVFDSEDAKMVLEDLKNRCFVKTSTAHELPHVTHVNEGMRTVFLHIATQITYKPVPEETPEQEPERNVE